MTYPLDITDEQRERELREWTTPGTAKSRDLTGAEDYRALLRIIDKERQKSALLRVGFEGKWKAEDKIFAVTDLEPYVDGGVISWELVKEALS